MLKKVIGQALVVSPCILGVTLVTDISSSLAVIATTPKSELTSLESQSVGGNITPLQISDFEISQATVSPNTEETVIESDSEIEDTTVESDTNGKETTGESDTKTEKTTIESDTEIEETTVESDTNGEETTGESDTKIEETAASDSNRWHFLFQPYLYIPITMYGDTTVGRLSRDFDIDFDRIKTRIKDDLNFAFLGDIQAWTPNYHIGIILNVDYLSLSSDDTVNRPVRRPGLADFIPTELDTNVDNQLWNVSLGAAYRFYDQSKVNPEGVSTEFDLGLLVFDVFGGLNITGVSTDLDLNTNFGGEASFDDSTTVVSPLLGGRLRLNVNPKLALVTTGSVAGFGISGLTKWNVMAGLDWMFSGNTSLGLGYRFAYTGYNSELDRGKDFGVTLNQNGPYLSFSFRF